MEEFKGNYARSSGFEQWESQKLKCSQPSISSLKAGNVDYMHQNLRFKMQTSGPNNRLHQSH